MSASFINPLLAIEQAINQHTDIAATIEFVTFEDDREAGIGVCEDGSFKIHLSAQMPMVTSINNAFSLAAACSVGPQKMGSPEHVDLISRIATTWTDICNAERAARESRIVH